MPLLASLALSYALVLVAPGPNLLIVLRVAVRPSWGRLLSVAAGIASGAAIASYLAAIGAKTLTMLDDLDMWSSVVLSSILFFQPSGLRAVLLRARLHNSLDRIA